MDNNVECPCSVVLGQADPADSRSTFRLTHPLPAVIGVLACFIVIKCPRISICNTALQLDDWHDRRLKSAQRLLHTFGFSLLAQEKD